MEYQIFRTIVGSSVGQNRARLAGHVWAIFGQFQVMFLEFARFVPWIHCNCVVIFCNMGGNIRPLFFISKTCIQCELSFLVYNRLIVIVNKLWSNILSPARRFGKVTEYLTEACRYQILSHLPNPECSWHKYLIQIY